jgi:hypothetical protein
VEIEDSVGFNQAVPKALVPVPVKRGAIKLPPGTGREAGRRLVEGPRP